MAAGYVVFLVGYFTRSITGVQWARAIEGVPFPAVALAFAAAAFLPFIYFAGRSMVRVWVMFALSVGCAVGAVLTARADLYWWSVGLFFGVMLLAWTIQTIGTSACRRLAEERRAGQPG